MRQVIIYISLFLGAIGTYGQNKRPAFLTNDADKWVDSVFMTLTEEEKVGQLLMPRGNYSGQPHDMPKLREWVTKYKIGGIVLFASQPVRQALVTNELQSLSKTPMLIGQDLEWGIGMRLDSSDRIPYNLTLGAIEGNNDLLEKMGVEIGKQIKRLGVHVNYAPVVDVNNNPSNPVINFRSFGSNRDLVAEKGLAIMKGMQSQNILCTAKHFPGHGDTDVDSHHDLPLIKHDLNRLKAVELYPFQKLINEGLSGIMTAHLVIPALDTARGLAATFSKKIVSDLLRKDMGFEGLTFTDAMNMEGAVKNFPKGEAMVQAILAGNDILETFIELPSAFDAILKAVKSGKIPRTLLDQRVRKILKAKYWVGLNAYQPIEINGLHAALNTPIMDLYNRIATEASITCLKNEENLLPIKDLTKKIAVVHLGIDEAIDFYPMVKNYTNVSFIRSPKNPSQKHIDSILTLAEQNDIIIASMHFIDIRPSRNYGLNDGYTALVKKLIPNKKVIFNLLGNAFILHKLPEFSMAKTLLLGYQQSKYTEQATAQMIFGALPIKGSLPVFINETYKEGLGIKINAINRLSYGISDQLGIRSDSLEKRIDEVVNLGLNNYAYPGATVSVAYKGKVIYQKAYGGQVFGERNSVTSTNGIIKIDDAMDNFEKPTSATSNLSDVNFKYDRLDDIYDLASVTKITTSALSLMQLTSEGKFDINKGFKAYVPLMSGSNKENFSFKDMLTHRSGLKAWIPFWRDAIDGEALLKTIEKNPSFTNRLKFDEKKPGFFKRLFGKKTKYTLNSKSSFASDPALLDDVLLVTPATWKPNTFSTKLGQNFSVKLHDSLYMHSSYKDTIFDRIKTSPININQGYVYSDLHYYLYPQIIQSITGMSFEDYLANTYKKIGANTLGFNPLQKFNKSKIVPTEIDSTFRRVLIHGYVHDEGAALLGGVSGHAGLFGNANDLTKLMQMYLQKGSYGGDRFFNADVIDQFSSYQFSPEEKNRRGIAFDKKDFNPAVNNGPSLASAASYGHSGFTGTFTWVDPELDLVYVFLSNRVYPTRKNGKISTFNIRTALGDAIIKTIKEGKNAN
jgi:beta-N-acetylhexosaminidase